MKERKEGERERFGGGVGKKGKEENVTRDCGGFSAVAWVVEKKRGDGRHRLFSHEEVGWRWFWFGLAAFVCRRWRKQRSCVVVVPRSSEGKGQWVALRREERERGSSLVVVEVGGHRRNRGREEEVGRRLGSGVVSFYVVLVYNNWVEGKERASPVVFRPGRPRAWWSSAGLPERKREGKEEGCLGVNGILVAW
ncbi:hypothetical protein HAX54_025804 [Datura stramonium]|uniref:Uncharacterized protein n=1 Tax=Datura stramonium TaxID=4076 RepID=A0ABS8V295_DATST|nr:hypothetical protein [Datura stramonium]